MADLTGATHQKSEQERQKRFLLLRKLRDEEITFDQLIEISNSTEFSVINKTSIAVIITTQPGWDKQSVRSALISYGIDTNASLRSIKRNEAHIDIIRHLCNSTSTQWQKRIAAPKGWPWFGNVLATLNNLEEGDLPREIIESTRFLTESEKKSADNPYDTEKEDQPTTSTQDDSFDDELDDLFGSDDTSNQVDDPEDDSQNDDEDDFLADILGD